MPYLILILFPIAIAAGTFILRRQTQLVLLIGLAALGVMLAIVFALPIDAPAYLVGLTLIISALGRMFLITFLVAGMIMLLAAWHVAHGENFVPVTLLVFALVSAIILLQDPFLITLLLVGAGVVLVLAQVDQPVGAGMLVPVPSLATAIKYLVLMVIAGVLMYLAFVLEGIYEVGDVPGRLSPPRLILALLSVGFALRLAVIPFHSWLPDLVEQAAPLVTALTVAVINGVSLLVFILSLERFPEISESLEGMDVLLAISALTAFMGAMLAQRQRGLRRVVAYLLVYNAGMLLFGLASFSVIGLVGAVFEAFNQTLAVVLLFVSLALLEQYEQRPGAQLRQDLLRRYPIAGVGFLGGGLALLGIPPLSGFASKIWIYQAAYERGWWLLVILIAATGLGVLALGQAARTYLLGPGDDEERVEEVILGTTELDRPAPRRRSRIARGPGLLTSSLLGICVAIGCYPQPLLATIEAVIRELRFLQAL